MTEISMSNQTDISVAAVVASSRECTLSDGRLTFMGTMYGASLGRALLRHGGKVHVLQVGDTIDRATVTEIGEGVVTLSCEDRTEQLRLGDA